MNSNAPRRKASKLEPGRAPARKRARKTRPASPDAGVSQISDDVTTQTTWTGTGGLVSKPEAPLSLVVRSIASGSTPVRAAAPIRPSATPVSLSLELARAEDPVPLPKTAPDLDAPSSPAAEVVPFPGKRSLVIRGIWQRLASLLSRHSLQKRMRVCESVSLGEKRFLAIVRVDSESLLLGGAPGNVSLLARLSEPQAFSSVLKQKTEEAALLR